MRSNVYAMNLFECTCKVLKGLDLHHNTDVPGRHPSGNRAEGGQEEKS